jgi:hypothetical protein
MSPCTLKLDDEKSKHVGLAQQNNFNFLAQHFYWGLVRLIKGTSKIKIVK